ncbi:DUF4395 domain-containing protein [Sulfurimonas paralvinellae]|uniref:DUF4395 domain-containing protein n=1 Tax=Sulfurimonas paralvinellae TaxID=317658 RepID=A0A7M1B9I4_9BACT|nr:DUF4395 domain-containing protein [Sulfurimonas paralvinellae]QOP45478.1 DUF4395 domain-containing protein [Sulfurimonas paralvinellae]
MANSCPLNFVKVDSNIARFSSLFVALLVIVYLITNNVWILYFLAFDFIMKLFLNPGISPIMMLATFLKGLFKIKDKFTDGGAKKLAGMFGLTFVILLIIAHYLDIWVLSLGIAIVFLICSLLDVFLNFCIGCKIYYIIRKIYPNFMNNL